MFKFWLAIANGVGFLALMLLLFWLINYIL